MKKLMIDMDNCITDTLILERVNEFMNTNYKLTDLTDFYLQNLTGDRKKDFWKFMEDKSFYDDVPLIDGAYDVLEKLNKKYDLYIITSYIYSGSEPDISANNLKYKYEYLKNKLPFISPEKYIFITNKTLIKSDIAIDDRIDNLTSADKKILMTAWHNRDIKESELNERNVIRVSSWKEIEKELL